MKPAAVDYLRKKRLDHRGIPMGSTSPYGGVSEADINTTGPLEEPLAAPLDDATAHEVDPLAQPAEVFAGHEQRAGTEDAGPRHSTVPAQVFQSIAAVAPSTVPSAPQDTRDADEIDAAREADRASRLTAGLELAGRQLVGGITRTSVGQGIGAAPSEVPTAMARVKSRQERAAEAIRLKRQGVMDQATLDENKSQAELRRAQAAHLLMTKKGGKAADADELESYKAVMSERYPHAAKMIQALTTMKGAQDLQNSLDSEEGRKTTIEAARIAANATRGEARTVREEAKADKAATDIPPGYEVAPDAHPGDEAKKKFSALVGSAEKMKGLTARMRKALAGTNGITRTLDPKTVSALQQLGTQIQIEAKNVAGLGALSGPDMALMNAIAADPTSIKTNLTVDLPKMLDQLDAWGDTQIGGETKATGIRKKGAGVEMVKIKRSKDGVTKSVSKATADALLKKGGYEVAP